ncbi:uncharacterized protein BT62DRAFT_931014 [Guyanagaster necrorhizus]|uniref:Uncharacterized protein n=1 Tax=Guyanagaster necrorhizus TaxID=856835 RepID=A0A9P7VTL8_9AGAR|nr:uncharacterized protein BT62DRAFT_931014 [Guyanagaster necrorhizus MCA 3950]KAG7447178.1 hypothetical protein BT62DRAFT_931014 [Guyanagaster necrorhizus MCA 3950]
MKFRPFLPRLNIKRATTVENDVDSKSTGSITPTLAYYCPPPEVEIPVQTRKEPPRPPTPTSRLTFLAIWDPDVQRYTLPHVPSEDQVPDDDSRFQSDSHLGQGHPDCEPHLSSRFSTSTTSTSNFITVSHSQTTLPFPTSNPRGSSLRQSNASPPPPPPPPSFPLQRCKPQGRIGYNVATHSTISIASLLSRRPTFHSRPGTPSSVKSRPSTPKSRPSTPARPRTSSSAHSPLSFIKRRVSSPKEADDAWVSLDVECVIRERLIRI